MLGACSYDDFESVNPVKPSNDSLNNFIVSYANDIKPMIVYYCYGEGNQLCHVTNTNQGSTGDFTTYAGLKAKVDNGSIASRVINPAGGMPPSYSNGPKPVSAEDKMKLQSWMDNGAPDN